MISNSVKRLFLVISKITACIEESNGNKYLPLVPNDEIKDTLKKFEELWSKSRDLVRSISNSSDDYEKEHIEVNSIQMTIYH